MTALSNVALSDTFTTLVNRVNQLAGKSNEMESIDTSMYIQANNANFRAIGAFAQANVASIQSIAAFAQANTVNLQSIGAFTKANTVNLQSIGAFTKANTVDLQSIGAFTKANTVDLQSIGAFDKANTVDLQSIGAFGKANTVNLQSIGAFTKANTVDLQSIGAFNAANAALNIGITANAAFAQANVANIEAIGAFTQANTTQVLVSSFRNRLINPNFAVSQRNDSIATSTGDNVYWADRWRYLGEGAGTCTGNDTTLGPAYRRNGKVLVNTGNDKFGCWQIIEWINCGDLRSQAVTVSAVIQVTNARVGNMKIGLVEWASTPDAVSADPIAAWGADGVTPTLAAGYTFLNTPININATTSPARYAVAGTPSASATNLAVFAWCDDKTTSNLDGFYITDVQLVPGSTVPTSCEYRPYGIELLLCQRYFQKLFDGAMDIVGYGSAGSAAGPVFFFPVEMRNSPTVVKSGTWAAVNCSQPSAPYISYKAFTYRITLTSLGTYQSVGNGADDYFTFNAEL